MKIICSYCHKDLGQKVPLEDQRLSHSICRDCQDYFLKQIEGLSMNDYLGYFKFPVIILNADYRILALNEEASRLTGKSVEESTGLLGGEVMECRYARLPEGCGNSSHCEACTIRRAVISVMKTGKSIHHIPVQLEQGNQILDMVITAKKLDNIVQLVIDKNQKSDTA